MAYFSNSSEGDVLDEQCYSCKLFKAGCPVALIQSIYNYKQHSSPLTMEVMNHLINEEGECQVFKVGKKWLYLNPDQLNFLEDV